MPDVLVTRRAPFAARLLASLVAFELGDDAVGELMRSAAEEYGLDRVSLRSPASDDGDDSDLPIRESARCSGRSDSPGPEPRTRLGSRAKGVPTVTPRAVRTRRT
jgi:hypothetical protein